MDQIHLPNSSWVEVIDSLVQIKLSKGYVPNADTLIFLQQLHYVDQDGDLTEIGNTICRLEYVTKELSDAEAIHRSAIVGLPVTQAILQSLWGLDDIDVVQVGNALIFLGVDQDVVKKRLITLLQILNRHKIIVYGRKNRSVKLLEAPLKVSITQAPDHIYIDQSRPFANDFYIREIIREAQGDLMWLDKYFQKEAFEWLWREAEASKLSSIRIVSSIGKEPLDKATIADYRKFKKELEAKGISVEWRILARSDSHDFHDRWILDDHELCYNLPSINSIKSGQRSELHKSPNGATIQGVFKHYFDAAKPV